MSMSEVIQGKLDAGFPVSQVERLYGIKIDPAVFSVKPRRPLSLVHSQSTVSPFRAGPDPIAEVAALLPDLDDEALRRVAALALAQINDRCGLAAMNRVIGAVQVASSAPPSRTVVDDPVLVELAASVAIRHGITIGQLRGDTKHFRFSHARQEAYWLARQIKNSKGTSRYSLPAIGKFFRRDHSTVNHGIAAHEKRMARAAA